MRQFEGSVYFGLREKDTNKVVAVYPEKLQGSENEIENKVKFWFYQQSCGAEDRLEDCYVDVVSDEEIKERKDQLH